MTGCQSTSVDRPENVETTAAQEISSPMEPSYEPSYSEPVTLTGVLEVDRLPSGKRFQGTWLLRDHASPLLLSYRPIEEHLHLVGKRVVVTGRHKTLSPNVQQVSADHFELATLTIHPEEKAPSMESTSSIPPAPLLEPESDLSAMHGRWVHVQGVALDATHDTSSFFTVPLQLSDGTTVLLLTLNDTEYSSSWQPLLGQDVTVLGKLWIVSGEEAQLSGPHHICAGHVTACPDP